MGVNFRSYSAYIYYYNYTFLPPIHESFVFRETRHRLRITPLSPPHNILPVCDNYVFLPLNGAFIFNYYLEIEIKRIYWDLIKEYIIVALSKSPASLLYRHFHE